MLGVPDKNGISLLYVILEIHQSGRQPSMCPHTEVEVADQTCYLTQSLDTSPSTDSIAAGFSQDFK